MPKSNRKSGDVAFQPRFRVRVGDDIALGPGKVELLEHIAATGSIAEAANHMRMSYMRAWTLVRTMNRCFRKPLVTTARGGRERGGTTLTETGRAALKLYRELEEQSVSATNATWQRLQSLFKD